MTFVVVGPGSCVVSAHPNRVEAVGEAVVLNARARHRGRPGWFKVVSVSTQEPGGSIAARGH